MACSSTPSFSLTTLRRWYSFPHGQHSFHVVNHMPTRNFCPQKLLELDSPHAILAFFIPVIFNLIEIKCQCKGNSPFDTNPISIWFSISCLLSYCFLHGIELSFSRHLQNSSNYSTALQFTTSLFGSLLLASLASIIFPDKIKPVLYTFYVLLLMGYILHRYAIVKAVWKWIDENIKSKILLHSVEGRASMSINLAADTHLYEGDLPPV